MTISTKPTKINTDAEFCECSETYVDGVHVKKPKWHNCDYIRLVNAKIEANCLVADRLVDTMPEKTAKQKEDRKAAWQRAFARHMDYDRSQIMLDMEEFERAIAKSIAEKDAASLAGEE